MSFTTFGTAEFEKKVNSKRVVVVGAGLAGALVARKLEKHAEVSLIDAKDFFEVPYAGRRCIVDPKLGERACFLHSDYLQKLTLVTNSAKTATKTEVVTDHGEHIGFDFLVIATDNAYKGALTREGRLEEFQRENKKLQGAKHVLVVGGGPTGCELAAEIVTEFPEVKVTLVHAGSRLLEFIDVAASKKALEWLQGRGVEVILDDKIENPAGTDAGAHGAPPAAAHAPAPAAAAAAGAPPSHSTAKGKKIPADVVFNCSGRSVGNSWLLDSDFKDALEPTGHIKVDDTLRVPGFPNVFAIGDITNVNEIKKGHFAEAHANVAIQNIKKLIKDPKCKQLNKYRTSSCLTVVVPLGRYSAICQTPCCVCSGRVAATAKCGDLWVSRTRCLLGLK